MEKYYYHVVTEKPMQLHQILKFGEDNQSGVYKRVMDKKDIVEDIYKNPDKYKHQELEHHTKVALRELALEEIRQLHYPTYPSRIASLYVSKDLNDSYMWADSFIKKGRNVLQIVKIKTTGNEFTGDAYNCFEGSIIKENNLKKSFNYWENKPNPEGKEPIYETIIDGDIEVVEIIKTYKEN